MNLRFDETDLVGKWLVDGTRTVADQICERIQYLTEKSLERLAVSRMYGAWETLFRDPKDARLWERTYPQGEMHGGGPPRLRAISEQEAREKYDF
jgi:hypothetical protein